MKKPFAKRILAAASAAALTVSIIPAVHGANASTVSGQLAASRCTADSAVMENLTPEMVRSVPAEAPLTRQGLCTLVMDSYCDVTGQEPEEAGDTARVAPVRDRAGAGVRREVREP